MTTTKIKIKKAVVDHPSKETHAVLRIKCMQTFNLGHFCKFPPKIIIILQIVQSLCKLMTTTVCRLYSMGLPAS